MTANLSGKWASCHYCSYLFTAEPVEEPPAGGRGGAHDAQGPHVACGWKKFGSFLMLSKDF